MTNPAIPEKGDCFRCGVEVDQDGYCYGCKEFICDDDDCAGAVAWSLADTTGHGHEPDDHWEEVVEE